ncbi:hypothetical protein MMC32_006340 [Xylographa parallela]|nr:hypothetical protein [Xylographa parallela]
MLLPLLLTTLLLPLALTTPLTLTYTPLSSPNPNANPHPLAVLLTAYTPPPPSTSLLRLSFSPSITPSSTLALASTLHLPNSHFLVLLSRLDNTTLSVSYHPGPAALTAPDSHAPPSTQPSDADTERSTWPTVRVAYAASPPQPVLNQPVVLNKEGVVPEEGVVEKTFLQK